MLTRFWILTDPLTLPAHEASECDGLCADHARATCAGCGRSLPLSRFTPEYAGTCAAYGGDHWTKEGGAR